MLTDKGEMTELHPWFDNMMALQIVAWILILFLVLGVVVKLWKPAKKFIEGMDTLFGSDEHPSLSTRLEEIETTQAEQGVKIEIIKREVLPNHGTSLRDKVDQIADTQEKNHERLKGHIEEAEESKAVIEIFKNYLEEKDE